MKYIIKTVAVFFLLAFIAGAWKSALENPEYDSDMLLYTGIYYMSQGNNLEMAHERIYDYKIHTLPEAAQRKLTESKYDQRCRDDSNYFGSMLPFCKVKLLYNLCVQWLTPYAGSPLLAMIYISLLSYSVIVLLLFIMLKKFLAVWLSAIITICICAFAPVLDSGRIFTPDSFSALLIFSGLMFMITLPASVPLSEGEGSFKYTSKSFKKITEKSFWLTMIFWLAAIMCRPENILYPFLFGIYLIWKTRNDVKRTISPVTVIILSLAFYQITTSVTDSYGWKITFQHSLVDPAKLPSELKNIPLTVSTYFMILCREIINHKTGILLLVFLFILSFFSLKNISEQKRKISMKEIYLLLSLVFALKFIIHPFFDQRFFILFYVISFAIISIGILPNKNTIIPDTKSLSS